MILVFLASVFIVISFAFWIDWKRKKNKNNPHIPTNPELETWRQHKLYDGG
ncbi:hypothetical protein [Bacillus sp. Y1]|nr:hypothetical protein [Bacillus sp. Y1]